MGQCLEAYKNPFIADVGITLLEEIALCIKLIIDNESCMILLHWQTSKCNWELSATASRNLLFITNIFVINKIAFLSACFGDWPWSAHIHFYPFKYLHYSLLSSWNSAQYNYSNQSRRITAKSVQNTIYLPLTLQLLGPEVRLKANISSEKGVLIFEKGNLLTSVD